MAKKECLFCGSGFSGQKRSFEHKIPRWLVKEADLASRMMAVRAGHRSFDVNMGKIGADVCERCNSNHSNLEDRAKQTFIKIRDGVVLEEQDLQWFLDWLDKVRTGLWLWLLKAGNQKISPNFRINNRMAAKDRAMIVTKFPKEPQMRGLALWACSDLFLKMPSVFGFLANNIAVSSISADFLLLRHMTNIKVARFVKGGAQHAADVTLSDNPGPRMRLLGPANIFGQVILPKSIFDAVDVKDIRPNRHNAGLYETPIRRLTTDFAVSSEPLGAIAVTDVLPDVALPLAELNLSLANDYLLRDYLQSDFSELRAGFEGQLAFNAEISGINQFLFDERLHRKSLLQRYRDVTGISLPID